MRTATTSPTRCTTRAGRWTSPRRIGIATNTGCWRGWLSRPASIGSTMSPKLTSTFLSEQVWGWRGAEDRSRRPRSALCSPMASHSHVGRSQPQRLGSAWPGPGSPQLSGCQIGKNPIIPPQNVAQPQPPSRLSSHVGAEHSYRFLGAAPTLRPLRPTAPIRASGPEAKAALNVTVPSGGTKGISAGGQKSSAHRNPEGGGEGGRRKIPTLFRVRSEQLLPGTPPTL